MDRIFDKEIENKRETNKSVLILTLLFNNYSYGCMLQAFALYKTLQKKGFVVKELYYHNSEAAKRGKKILIRKALSSPFSSFILWIRHRVQRKKYLKLFSEEPLKKIFDSFIIEHFDKTELYDQNTVKGINGYQYYITGGDQVWNPVWLDKNYFLDFAHDGKKISFSASIGKDVLTEEELKFLCREIKTLQSISVREQTAQQLLLSHNINVKQIMDPVFLLTGSEWNKLAKKQKCDKRYIFAFILGEEKEIRIAVEKFKNKNACHILALNHIHQRFNSYDKDFADIFIHGVDPFELVGLIADAEMVITDSFHCISLCLILNKQFLCVDRFFNTRFNSQSSRIKDLLAFFNISNRMVTPMQLQEMTYKEVPLIDYTLVSAIISEERKRAHDFIDEALG